MLSLDYIRNNKDKVIQAAKNKKRVVEIEKILELDEQRKKSIHQIQALREDRNKQPKSKPSPEDIQKGKKLKEEINKLEKELAEIETHLNHLLSFVPNVPLEDAPVGDASHNKQIKTWGEIKKFSFEPKNHIQLGQDLDLLDLERGTKVSGFRGYFLKNELAQLHLSLLFYVFNELIKKGYSPLITPSIVKGFSLFGSGQFPWGEKEVYKLNDSDSYLAGTSEVPATAYFANEILNEQDLPKKFVLLSSCFRKEAGSYGKDTKGLYRVHEFWKIEQLVLAKNSLEEALTLHDELQKNSEQILESLELPYQVVLMSTEEMGEPQIKKYDTETWMPSRNAYSETMSNSIMGDFQTRRLNIKYRKKTGETEFCYSLNNTAIATPRILIPLLENHQQEDGSVLIPKALQQYTGFDRIKVKVKV
ncbi:MAG: serine--tRNA ligase [Patescibacteria group bacterium]